MVPLTMYRKIWDAHHVATMDGGENLLYIDRHFLYEVTSPQAFEGLRLAGRRVRRPEASLAMADHNVPTEYRSAGLMGVADLESRHQIQTLERNAAEFGIPYVPLTSPAQGIVHIVGPELGLTLPGMTIVCGDSHTSTHGAFGALAFGIGTSEVEHVLATQTLIQAPSKTMLIKIDGSLGPGVSAKDIILFIIQTIGTAGAAGHVIEYAGEVVRGLDMAGRMTICNMSIEAGARAGMIAPDETTFAWIAATPNAPTGANFEQAKAHWLGFVSDEGAIHDRFLSIDASRIEPMVTWGTSPDAATAIGGRVPDPDDEPDPDRRRQIRKMIDYMGLAPNIPIAGIPVDIVFIGSCTNSRIEDLRAAASVARGRSVAAGVRALVVPGSGAVKAQSEAEGLDQIFRDAGFEWRDPGCSMCLGLNPDRLKPGQRCASTSNRNFEGRQGPGGRTHLLSPTMAAAAAITGYLTDVRALV